MSGAQENATNASPLLGAGLDAGWQQVSADQTVEFTFYQRFVLPLDGFVFWIRQSGVQVSGSLHVSAQRRQEEAEMLGVDRIWFTTSTEVAPFNQISPQRIAVGRFSISGDTFQFAFSQRGPYIASAGLFHYLGESINPVMEAQLINNESQINSKSLIVSNSLPAWLALQSYTPFWLTPLNPGITLYPSFLVDDNELPPYGAVHIEPTQTRALQALASFDNKTTHSQLAADRVRITLFGLTNDQSMDFLDLITQYCADNEAGFGLMSTPVVRDEKRTQVEIMAIAMKKSIEVDVSYYQSRMNDIARQQLKAATVSFSPEPFFPS